MRLRALLFTPRLLPVLAVSVTIGCAATTGSSNHPPSGAWVRKGLGGRPDGVLVLRLDRARNDPVYGPLIREGLRDPELDATLSSIGSVEVWVIADGTTAKNSSWLLAIHALPALKAARPWWQPWARYLKGARPLPSGALEFTTSIGGTLLGLYGYPDGTVIAATGAAVARLADRARRGAAPPPPTSYGRDAIFAVHIGPRIYHLPDLRSNASHGLQAVWAVIHPSERGDLVLGARYDDVADARSAHELLTSGVKELASEREDALPYCPALAQLKLGFHREGRTLSGYIGNIPAVLVAIRDGRCG